MRRWVTEALVVAQAKVLLLQWTGVTRQKVSVPWTHVTDFNAADALADTIRDVPREWRSFSTAIGEAVGTALIQFDAVPECKRRVIDVSGDGVPTRAPRPKR